MDSNPTRTTPLEPKCEHPTYNIQVRPGPTVDFVWILGGFVWVDFVWIVWVDFCVNTSVDL